jgi:hypothetical protein
MQLHVFPPVSAVAAIIDGAVRRGKGALRGQVAILPRFC